MAGVLQQMIKKGYMPLAGNEFAAIGFEGNALNDFWMWTKSYIETAGGEKVKKTVKVESLKEAALHYWRDRWLPVEPIDEDFLLDMENALRSHIGLKREGIRFPDGEFLEMPEENI